MKNQIKEGENTKKGTILKLSLIIIIIMITFLAEISLAKNIEKIETKYQIQYAQPILTIEDEEKLELTNENREGTYQFKIKNYNEQQITDVDINYYIEILDNNNENLQYKLYLNNEEIQLKNKKTDIFELQKEIEEEHIYKLEIIYKKENKHIENEEQREIKIKIHGQQEVIE